MNTSEQLAGSCLCGAVTLTTGCQQHAEACHYGNCRRWGGGPLLAVHCGADVHISGAELVAVYDSSDWAQRGFCKTCGTHLFYRFKHNNEYIVPAGLFQDAGGFELKEQIFIDKKPDWYSFANQTSTLTEAEVFSKYAPD